MPQEVYKPMVGGMGKEEDSVKLILSFIYDIKAAIFQASEFLQWPGSFRKKKKQNKTTQNLYFNF